MTYNVFSGTLNPTHCVHSLCYSAVYACLSVCLSVARSPVGIIVLKRLNVLNSIVTRSTPHGDNIGTRSFQTPKIWMEIKRCHCRELLNKKSRVLDQSVTLR